ncbi:MAG: DUF433 domain-containing protein [Bacillota bacterium]
MIESLAGDEATMAWQDLIEVNPAVLKGKPVIRGTRVPVHLVVGNLAGGASIADVTAAYAITEEQVRAYLTLAGHSLDAGRGSHDGAGLAGMWPSCAISWGCEMQRSTGRV